MILCLDKQEVHLLFSLLDDCIYVEWPLMILGVCGSQIFFFYVGGFQVLRFNKLQYQ